MTTPLEDVQEFHTTFSLKDVFLPNNFPRPELQVLDLRVELIKEEVVRETLPAFLAVASAPTLENMTELADGLIDTLYVTYGALIALDFPTEKLWKEVQRSNMSKVWPDGTVHKREDGKVLKPPGFQPPDLHSIMLAWWTTKVMANDKPIMSNFNPDAPRNEQERQDRIDRYESQGINPKIVWSDNARRYIPNPRYRPPDSEVTDSSIAPSQDQSKAEPQS